MMNVLVTGGAGYIGSHTVACLAKQGHTPVVYDNLCFGHRQAIEGVKFVEGDIRDRDLLRRTIREQAIEAVIHFAAFAYVGESVIDPGKYYHNNVVGTIELLEAIRAENVQKIVFSSTCATYGEPTTIPIDENTPQAPINPYGFSKLVVERALDDYAHAYGLQFAALRYFNASGCAIEGNLGEDHTPETHLIPLILQVALGQREQITIFGDDFDTPDGTCVRDYIHVDDLASAHVAALERLSPGTRWKINLGTGQGYSVREVIDSCRRITGHEIPAVDGPRREGDPPRLIAANDLAKQLLGWQPQHREIDTIVNSAWQWMSRHPNGYEAG